jgi:myosin heavy subunit
MLSEAKNKKSNQAVIISGESGAGKTEANKECLRFLQHYFHQEKEASIDKDIDNILSLSNPILEAFGNSKTIRNNNSSRFGKFLNISINAKLQVKHVKIYNYLLEKSRIISRAENEQNFHIFYELLKGLSKT